MFLEKSKSRIEANYENLKKEFPGLMAEVDGKLTSCETDVQLALKYLYTTMPASDIGNYDLSVFEDYAKQGVYLYHNCSYISEMSEEMFLNYVLYHRINEEEIAPCRTLFYDCFKDRIQGKTMKEAALEINYWCAEEATYQSTDGRTAPPILLYRCGHGRCGEESTFTISALRSAGIPARQVYAPRWCHCDDNHAWVEVWCDGEWYFLGACEPEEILNKGWFTNASSRAMLIHSRWFDSVAPEGEDYIGSEGTALVLNQLKRYAATKRIQICVKNADGTPAADTNVTIGILNYSYFAPVALLKTDENGMVEMTTGFGSIQVSARKDGLLAEGLIDTNQADSIEITLKEPNTKEGWQDFDIIAPVDTPVNTDQPTEEQKKIGSARLAEATEKRLAKVKKFVPDWETAFKEGDSEEDVYCRKVMEILTIKDRIDAKPEIIRAHVREALPLKGEWEEEIFLNYIMNPRVATEVLSDWRGAIAAFFAPEEKETFRKDPKAIWNWIEEHIKECSNKERLSIYTMPEAALKLGTAGKPSKKLLFVAIARTLGIPARFNPVDGAMEYYSGNAFVAVEESAEKSASVILKETGKQTWTYMQNWTISKLGEKGFELLDLWECPWTGETFRVELEPGIYRLVTANRLPNGNIFGKQYDFEIRAGEQKEVVMDFRDAKLSDMLENISILPFHVFDEKGEKVQAADLTREGRKILFWLEESKEPTEHILNELMERKEEFMKYRQDLLFIIRTKEALKDPTLAKCRTALPDIPVYYDTFAENVNTLGRRMYVDPDKLPLIIVTDGELNGVYATSGYNVGTADMLLRILEM